MTNIKRVLLIINPNAGKKAVQQRLYSIISVMTEYDCLVTVKITQYRGHATEIAETTDPKDYDLIVCVGGDGTLNEVACGIIKSGTAMPLGYIPAGSTNDFATTLGLSSNMQLAAKDAVVGNLYAIDVGKFQERYFSYVASFGIFTKASYSTQQAAKNRWGSIAYILEGIKDITAVHEYKLQIEADGKIIDDKFIFGAVANSTSLGGMISIDPSDVALDDGMFEYLLVKKPCNPIDLIRAVNAIKTYDYSSDMLYFGNAKQIKVHSTVEMDWSLDGEHAHTGTDTVIENLHHAIKLMLPKQMHKEHLISNENDIKE